LIKLVLTVLPLITLTVARLKRQLVATAVAGVFGAFALFWGSVAAFLALVPVWGAPGAAGAVASAFLVLALLVKLIWGRRRPPIAGAMPMAPASVAAATGAVAGASSPTLLAALLAGYMAGKNR
jgi:hypothetical protein